MGPGPLIAIDVISLYALLGPLVLLGIYVFFDSLGNAHEKVQGLPPEKSKEIPQEKKDPALWNSAEIDRFLDGI